MPHFLDRWLVQWWVWALGGVKEAYGRGQGGAQGQLGHPGSGLKAGSPWSCSYCLIIPASENLASWLW